MENTKPKLNTDLWSTPKWLFDELNAKYGPFNLDVCADDTNAKCFFYYTVEDNGLEMNWAIPVMDDLKAWMNPPYSNPYPWIKKASEESKRGCTVVALVNKDHTTKWWKEFIEDPTKNYQPYPGVEIHKLPKRIKFDAPPGFIEAGGKVTTNTRPSVVVVFRHV